MSQLILMPGASRFESILMSLQITAYVLLVLALLEIQQ